MRRDTNPIRFLAGLDSFNPRAYVRRDRLDKFKEFVDILFQSTRLRETRPSRTGRVTETITFQSTRLRETRQNGTHTLKQMSSFNPRAYVRRDGRRG